MKKFIRSAILLVMLSCGNIETNPVSIESVEETKSVTVVDSCLLRKIVTYVKCFEIDSEEIIVVEFVNKWPETYKKGMIDTLAALSTKTKDNFFYGYDRGYKGCFKIKDNFVEIYDSLNIGSSFYCKGLLVDTVLYATQERDTMPKGFLILMKEYDTLSFCYFEPSC